MRKFKVAASLLGLWLSVGCGVSSQSKKEINLNANRCDRFVQLMDSNKTTRQQEQDFIRANRRAWWALNYAINDAPLPADLASIASETEIK